MRLIHLILILSIVTLFACGGESPTSTSKIPVQVFAAYITSDHDLYLIERNGTPLPGYPKPNVTSVSASKDRMAYLSVENHHQAQFGPWTLHLLDEYGNALPEYSPVQTSSSLLAFSEGRILYSLNNNFHLLDRNGNEVSLPRRLDDGYFRRQEGDLLIYEDMRLTTNERTAVLDFTGNLIFHERGITGWSNYSFFLSPDQSRVARGVPGVGPNNTQLLLSDTVQAAHDLLGPHLTEEPPNVRIRNIAYPVQIGDRISYFDTTNANHWQLQLIDFNGTPSGSHFPYHLSQNDDLEVAPTLFRYGKNIGVFHNNELAIIDLEGTVVRSISTSAYNLSKDGEHLALYSPVNGTSNTAIVIDEHGNRILEIPSSIREFVVLPQ